MKIEKPKGYNENLKSLYSKIIDEKLNEFVDKLRLD